VAEGFKGSEKGRPGSRLKLSELVKKHFSEAFYALFDPLEAAVFSVLVEMMKELAEVDDAAKN
jgi:hypothetical protein